MARVLSSFLTSVSSIARAGGDLVNVTAITGCQTSRYRPEGIVWQPRGTARDPFIFFSVTVSRDRDRLASSLKGVDILSLSFSLSLSLFLNHTWQNER